MTQHSKVIGAHGKIRALVVTNENNVNVVFPDTHVETYESAEVAAAWLRGEWTNISPEEYNEILTKWRGGKTEDADLSKPDNTEGAPAKNNTLSGGPDAGSQEQPADDGDGNSEQASVSEQATEGSADSAGDGEAGASDAGQLEPQAGAGTEAATG